MSRILQAEEKHIPELLRLLVQVNMVHHNGRPDLFKGPTTKYDADELKALLSDPRHRILVCEEDDRLLGYLMGELKETKESRLLQPVKTLYIDDLCVDESARRQKVGSRLFEEAKAEAVRLGCSRICLTVWELNPGARRFYETMGMLPLNTTMELPTKS
ncbi:MAG: GNAT family N-acetyltransferase [Lachnospiraceae bacterium]|nr:GNAT family N-acetyltransferase [Lachnospiraceae bacterium]